MNGDERTGTGTVSDESKAGNSGIVMDEQPLTEQLSRFRENVLAEDASTNEHATNDAAKPSVEEDVSNIGEDNGRGRETGTEDLGKSRDSRGREGITETSSSESGDSERESTDDDISTNPELGNGEENPESGSQHGSAEGKPDVGSSEPRALDDEVRGAEEEVVVGSTPLGEVRQGSRTLFGGVWI